MNKLTLFFSELITDVDQLTRFNSGSNKAEIAKNRQAMLKAAGLEDTQEIIGMDAQVLQKLIVEHLAQHRLEVLAPTVSEMVVAQALKYPKKVAIIDGEAAIDYHTLIQKANAVAGELKQLKVAPGALVGVCMERSWQLVASLIGVMQAGCAYVPIDPAYPKSRAQYMLSHSKAEAAIVDSEGTANLCHEVATLVWANKVGNYADETVRATPEGLAYVIYTSGSTGQPKGVAIQHKQIVGVSRSMRTLFDDDELSGVFAGASVCFDTSVLEILGTLSLGGTIILAKNALELPKLHAVNQIKTVVIVPSSLQALLTAGGLPEGLRSLVFGGEALKRSLVDQVYALQPDLRVLNAYGPTEDTVYSTIAEVAPGTQVVTIGSSVPGSRAYILNEAMQPVANEEAGELYLAGSKLAKGYLYNEALTKARFVEMVPNPEIPEERLYKTGDMCCWTASGEITFLGRIDQQVKVRGYRIELGEIESTLELMAGVEAAAVIATEGGTGQKMLVAYMVNPKNMVTDAEIKAYLMQRLPKYMVPQVFRFIEALPLLPNDKLDRDQLMKLEVQTRNEQVAAGVKPDAKVVANEGHMPLEVILHTIQQQAAILLNLGGTTQVIPHHTLDSMGLDSLTMLEFSSRLSKVFELDLSADAIIEYPTPTMLANFIAQSKAGNHTVQPAQQQANFTTDTLSGFQSYLQSSHPTFQAAKAAAWNATDKGILVQEVLRMVNHNRRNPYSKVLQTGSATRGLVGDAYNDEAQEAIIWTTNLYLGLNRDPEVMEEAASALAQYGTGMGTSAAASGMTNQHLEFESAFAHLVGKPGACLFPTGYTANVGAVAGLLGKNDVVVIDQLCHASIVDGARLCGATIRTFQHNNAKDLEAVLAAEVSPYRTVLVVLEGVYSMGEGAAPVAEIVHTAKKYDALVLVDEAHSFGFYGKNGAGICAAQGVTEQVDFIMTTLSKALGSLGGVVAASHEHVALLKSSSRAYIFQASVSPADMAAALTALKRLSTDKALRERLWDTTRYMRQQFEAAGYDLGTGDGPIVTPHFSNKDKLYAIVQHLYQKGVQTSAVTYPIVEHGRGRLRFICSAAHTRADVDKTLKALIEAEREVDQQMTDSHQKVSNTNIASADVEGWARTLSAYLEKAYLKPSLSTPALAIAVNTIAQPEPVTLMIKDGVVSANDAQFEALPSCTLHFKQQAAVKALLSADGQGLLQSICDGGCVLNGQVEPFIWLFARIVAMRKAEQIAEKANDKTLSAMVE